MSEFLDRGYNVAIPEVDVGDDIFVVQDTSGEFVRVQVKTSTAKLIKKGETARYSLRLSQLAVPTVPELWYTFATRQENKWGSYLIISRQTLYEFYENGQIGNVNKSGYLNLYMRFINESVFCREVNLSMYVNDWSEWPNIKH